MKLEDIESLILQFNDLHERAYAAYKPEVESIIKQKSKDEKTILHTLDGLLDFCSYSQMLELFRKLCRYYWYINPQVTAEYVIVYREMWNSEETDLDE